MVLDILLLPSRFCSALQDADLLGLYPQVSFSSGHGHTSYHGHTLVGDQRPGGKQGIDIYSPDSLFAGSLQAVWVTEPKVRTPVTQTSAQGTLRLWDE